MILFGDKLMTPRMRLRRVGQCDIPMLVSWSNSRAAYGEFLTPERVSEEKISKDFAAGIFWTDRSKTFFVELKDGTPLGTLQYWLRPDKKQCAVMAIKIADPRFRNRGFGTEAQKYVIIYLFQRMKLDAVEMYTDINNSPQQACLRKLGFELVESLHYEDLQVLRAGHLFRLDALRFSNTPMYHFYYE